MERQRFCVYNQTSECFLSLGVTVADTMSGRLKKLNTKPAIPHDEDLWVVPSKGLHTVSMRMAKPVDLLYLDGDYHVIQVVESSSKLHIALPKLAAASVLALPAHTIYSSQTQPGNQLVICAAEALEFRLKSAAESERMPELPFLETAKEYADRASISPERGIFDDRRRAPRQLNPRLVACDWNGDNLAVLGIRDASTTGLYLLTEKRWALGTMVVMTLQRRETVEENSGPSIAAQLEVVRCGVDGVGLQFVSPGVLDSTQWIEAEHVRRRAR
jgi:uncharacterized membrane protein (UPF0127 family)